MRISDWSSDVCSSDLGCQISASVVIDDAFGIAGCTRGVVQRNGIPFVVDPAPIEIGIARCDQAFVVGAGKTLRSTRLAHDGNTNGRRGPALNSLAQQGFELGIVEQKARKSEERREGKE